MNDWLKIQRLIKVITKIINSTLNKDIKIKNWSRWDINWNEVEIDWTTLLKTRWKTTLSNIFTLVWHSMFTQKPIDYVLRLTWDTNELKVFHSLALETLNNLRVQELVMFEYPWTRDFFTYAFRDEKFNNLEKHKIFLYEIGNHFFWLEYQTKDESVLNWLKVIEKSISKLLSSKTLNEMMKIFEKDFLKTYMSFYLEKEKEDNDEDWGWDNTSESTIKKEVEEEWDLEKEINDLINWEKDKKDKYSNLTWYNDIYDSISHLVVRFTKKLNSILKDNNYDRVWWAFRSWKLNTNKLYKIVLNDVKIFKRKQDRKHKEYLVSLLIDSSWSMQWWKNLIAMKSASLLSEVLDRVWIPFEIIWFNLDYKEYKKINQKFDHKVRNRLFTSIKDARGNNWNNDWFAVRKAHHSLKINSKQNTERIILVLSDWKPAPYWHLWGKDKDIFKLDKYEDFDLEKEVLRASQDSKIIGIGIQDNSVSKFYKDYIVVNDIELLPEILLNKLKSNIKRW